MCDAYYIVPCVPFSSYKNTAGLNRRTELYLKENDHIRRYVVHGSSVLFDVSRFACRADANDRLCVCVPVCLFSPVLLYV